VRSPSYDTTLYTLPHQNLIAYRVACDLLVAVFNSNIRDPKLRDQALRAAKSACLNVAEANGRDSEADRRRVFAIARGGGERGDDCGACDNCKTGLSRVASDRPLIERDSP
jgi:23S rRNA-intervening sequence protein